jgi:hypothetical protein
MPYYMDAGPELAVRAHLANLSRGIRRDGKVPILFLDGIGAHARFVWDKARKSIRDRRPSFMLRRYVAGELENLTPGTRDSEILYLFAMGAMAKRDPEFVRPFERHIEATLEYVRRHILKRDGLATGADWRDTMEKELSGKALLTNNALLYAALRGLGRSDDATRLLAAIRQTHFRPDRIVDYPGVERFDPLGGALAVLHDVATTADYPLLSTLFQSVDSPTGFTIKCRHNPISAEERRVIEETDGVVTWPFVVGFAVLALLKMNETSFAIRQLKKMESLHGFYEYYDPRTGKGYGEPEQLWSATMYLRALDAARNYTLYA